METLSFNIVWLFNQLMPAILISKSILERVSENKFILIEVVGLRSIL